MRALIAVCLLVVALGCGPVESTALILEADVELEAARNAQAQTYAPYQYVAAEAYLWKARELQGYAEYQSAIDFAARSVELAKEAKAKSIATRQATTPEGQ